MSITISGVEATCAELDKAITRKRNQAIKGVRQAGNELERNVKKLAPVDTGQYRASIRLEPQSGVMYDGINNPYVIVGTPMPQACRLEYGFWDMVDKLGRRFFQRAQPHFRPALDLNSEHYKRIIEGAVDSADMLIEGEY